ncbi:MAG: hypothetical protein H6667_02665 [Ardenticatenaceae bacterium]|nr:hypothetical protein [Ardenticatenaceae bacterium]MCB9445643.1 hypothetical protein [Ardenticatenaceae bacterium]
MNDLAGRRIQIVTQCLQQATAVQDDVIEQTILQNLLDIRMGVKGNILVNYKHIKEIKDYLLRFANKPIFYKYALEFAVKELKNNVSIKILMANLLQFCQSSDSDLAVASLQTLRDLVTKYDSEGTLLTDDVVKLFEHPSEQVKKEILHFVCYHDNLLGKRAIRDKAIDFALGSKNQNIITSSALNEALIERMFNDLNLLLPLEFNEDEIQLIQKLPELQYENEADKKTIRDTLWKAYSKSRQHTQIKRTLATSIVLMSSEDEKKRFGTEFLKMLRTGSPSEQILAASSLSQLMQNMEKFDATDDLIKTLSSPHKNVRRAVINNIKSLNLNSSQKKRVVAILDEGLLSFSFSQRMKIYLKQAIVGKGQVGINFAEKQEIIRTLINLNTTYDPLKLEKRLLQSMNEENIEHVLQCLETLNSDFVHKLNPEIVSKVLRIYDDLVVRNIKKGNTDRDYVKIFQTVKKPLIDELVVLTKRMDKLPKQRIVDLILDEIEKVNRSEFRIELLQHIHDLNGGSTRLQNNIDTWIFPLLEHKDWYIANTAFELLVQYKMI